VVGAGFPVRARFVSDLDLSVQDLLEDLRRAGLHERVLDRTHPTVAPARPRLFARGEPLVIHAPMVRGGQRRVKRARAEVLLDSDGEARMPSEDGTARLTTAPT
jgi:hypothetical protein